MISDLTKTSNKTIFSDILFTRKIYFYFGFTICGALRNLVPFPRFKKREKHPWRSVNFSAKSSTLPWMFFTLLKVYKCCQTTKASHMPNLISGAGGIYNHVKYKKQFLIFCFYLK